MTTIAPSAAEPTRFGVWWRRFWVPVVLVLIALGYGGTTTLLHTKALSPVDEWVYSDYLDKVPTELLVHQGELVGTEARERIACDGIYPYGLMGQPCGSSYNDPAKFPFAGKTSADAYTPIYFASTWAVGKVFQLIPGVSDLEGWRLTGSLWLAATVLVLYLIFRRFNIHPVATIGIGTALIVSPFSWWTYTFVSTDAPSAFFGGLLLLLALRYIAGRGSGWWIVGVSALAVLVKVTNILGVCLAALVLLLTWLWELKRTRWSDGWRSLRPDGERRSLGLPAFAVYSVVAAVVAQLSWLGLHRMLAVGPAANQGVSNTFGVQALLEQTVNFLPGTLTSTVVVAGANGSTSSALPMYWWALVPLTWLCTVGVLGSFFALRMRSRLAPLIVSIAIASVAFSPMLAVVIKVTTGSYFTLPGRYGAVLLVAFLLTVGLLVRNRWAAWVILGYSALLGVGMIVVTYHLSGLH